MQLEEKTLEEYIQRYQVDGVLWKAEQLLTGIENKILLNDRFQEVALMLALIPDTQLVAREMYAKQICKDYNLSYPTLKKLISDSVQIQRKKSELRKTVRKNRVSKLDGDPRKFRFFDEVTKVAKDGTPSLVKIEFDKFKFVQLLSSFGITRFETDETASDKDGFTFVMLKDNIISNITRNQIIDRVETFIKNEYDFLGAEYYLVDSERMIREFYDQMKTMFNKDLFARVRNEEKIIISKDTAKSTFIYYQNGFVEITKDGYELKSYELLSGSVWEHQMLDRNFESLQEDKIFNSESMGVFANYCYKIANDNDERFKALCCIIGYLIHDFYEYKLKSILFTDSSLTEESDGRTGKTLLSKMIGLVRSYCEINGKDFDANNTNKYQDANLGTQIIHLNDVKHKGRNRFNFEDTFNDITEGYIVNKKFMPPFRQYSKFILSSNKTLNIQGASQRDRILEFEMSAFFGEHRSPADYYNQWFGRDWDEAEFNRFDNFMCVCAKMFHTFGLMDVEDINLGERKLLNHTSIEFLEFMDSMDAEISKTGKPYSSYQYPVTGDETFSDYIKIKQSDKPVGAVIFDKKDVYERFLSEYVDFKKWLTQRHFTNWMRQYAMQRFDKKPLEWKSNGKSLISLNPK